MVVHYVEYVSEDEVLADIAIKSSASASLRTSNAIILAVLLLASYILNIVLLTTIYTNKKFRTSLIYLMFAHISLVNLVDLSFSVLISMLFVANGNWMFGDEWCKISTAAQEFCHLYTMLLLMLAAVERAVGLSFESRVFINQRVYEQPPFFTFKRILVFALLLGIVSLAVSIPSATGLLPVKPFRNRYVCSVSSGAPLGYTLTRAVLYIGCLCVLLVCLSAIFKKRVGISIPQQTSDYSEFISRNRAKQEFLSRAKLVVFLVCIFIVVAGPYISLTFTFEICNSLELGSGNGPLLDIPQDADTLITWLMFLFPLLSPIAILCWCTDIWLYTKELFCCRSDNPSSVGYFTNYNKGMPAMPPVMTLVATPQGLQLRLPQPLPNNSQNIRQSNMLTVPEPDPPMQDKPSPSQDQDHGQESKAERGPEQPAQSSKGNNRPAAKKASQSKIKSPTPIGQLKSTTPRRGGGKVRKRTNNTKRPR